MKTIFMPGMLVVLTRDFRPYVYLQKTPTWDEQGPHCKFYSNEIAVVIGGEIDDSCVTTGERVIVPIMIGGNSQIGYINVEIICSADEIKSEQQPTEIL